MGHKLQNLFHDFANRISAMNHIVAMPALSFLGKDLNSLTDEEKKNLLARLNDAFKKSSNVYYEVINTEDNIITQLSYVGKTADILDYFNVIMDIIHEAARKNSELFEKVYNYKLDDNFESFIKPILQEALEFDKQMATIAQKLEEAKDLLRKQGLYPKPGDENYA